LLKIPQNTYVRAHNTFSLLVFPPHTPTLQSGFLSLLWVKL